MTDRDTAVPAAASPFRPYSLVKPHWAALVAAILIISACSDPGRSPDPEPPNPIVDSAVDAVVDAVADTLVDAVVADTAADFTDLDEGWNTISPAGDTVCSDGSDYRFFVWPGDSDKLMFYLEGGGACWSGINCDPTLQPSYQVNLAATDPSTAHGVLAFQQPANPLADYTVVYAPYCSGDVHLGDTEQHYPVPAIGGRSAGEVHVEHRGWVNASAALDWTYSHIPAPQQIFVAGSSAGSIPSPFYAVKLAEHYPDADVVQLGDGSGGYRGFANFSPYDVWALDDVVSDLPNIADITANEFGFQHLYLGAAQINSDIRFASYDNAEDEVQKQFLAFGGAPASSLQPLLEMNLAEIGAAIPSFRYYVAGGAMHTILLRPEVYTYQVGGVSFVDWLGGLLRGENIQNVMCSDCGTAPGADSPGS